MEMLSRGHLYQCSTKESLKAEFIAVYFLLTNHAPSFIWVQAVIPLTFNVLSSMIVLSIHVCYVMLRY